MRDTVNIPRRRWPRVVICAGIAMAIPGVWILMDHFIWQQSFPAPVYISDGVAIILGWFFAEWTRENYD